MINEGIYGVDGLEDVGVCLSWSGGEGNAGGELGGVWELVVVVLRAVWGLDVRSCVKRWVCRPRLDAHARKMFQEWFRI